MHSFPSSWLCNKLPHSLPAIMSDANRASVSFNGNTSPVNVVCVQLLVAHMASAGTLSTIGCSYWFCMSNKCICRCDFVYAANKTQRGSLSSPFFLSIHPLECRDVWFQLRRPCTLYAAGTALKPHCQLGRSHFDPCRFILIRYMVYRVQKRV